MVDNNQDIFKYLENFSEYLSNVEQIELWPLPETDRTELYCSIRKFFDKEKSKIGLRFIVEMENYNNKERYSSYYFRKGPLVEILESAQAPAVIISYDNETVVKNKTYLLLHSIKESLGIELSIKEL